MENKMIDQMCSEGRGGGSRISEKKKKKNNNHKTPLTETSVQFTSKIHQKKKRKLISI